MILKTWLSMANDVTNLLDAMKMYEVVLGGSRALQYFHPDIDEDAGDYDFFTSVHNVEGFKAHLERTEHYTVVSDHVAATVIHDVHHFQAGIARIVQLRRGDTTVEILGAAEESGKTVATVPLAFAWCSMLMTFIASEGVCCAYPTLTMARRGLVQGGRMLHWSFPEGEPATRLRELEKYQRRGFVLRTYADDWDVDGQGRLRPCSRSWLCPLRERRFGDGGCLTLHLNEGSMMTGLGTGWVLGGLPCDRECVMYEERATAVIV